VQKLVQYVSAFSLPHAFASTPPFSIGAPSASSSLPVSLSVSSGPASITGTPGAQYVITLSGTEGRVVIAANQTGNIDYFPAPAFTTDFYVIRDNYNISIPVNKFFYTGLSLQGLTGTIIASGLPDGLSFNRSNNSIIGAPNFTGIFDSYIFESGKSTGYIGLDFTINSPTNTGFLYAFGSGVGYGENSVPTIFSDTVVKQVVAGNGFDIAVATQNVYVPPPVVPIIVPPAPVPPPICQPYLPYTFVLKNNSAVDCIDDFTFISTLTGNCSGYLDSNLAFGYISGTPGTTSVASIVASGYSISQFVPYIMPPGCISMIFAGGSFGIMILNNGQISGWGDNTYGQAQGGFSLTGQCPYYPAPLPSSGVFWSEFNADSCVSISLTSASASEVLWGDGTADTIASGDNQFTHVFGTGVC
jgi:hypothetical protein